MANAISGLQPLAGINIIKDDAAFATPEERSGGIADERHSHIGEQAVPYSWESQAMPGGTHGPYGPENQLLDDEYWFIEPAGIPAEDPNFDRNTPSLTRSHGSVRNVGNSGPLPSQYDAINRQVSQMANKASDLGTSRNMSHDQQGYAQQDNWHEIWEINNGNSDLPPVGKQFSHQAFGFGVNDAVSNTSAKHNAYQFDSKHQHRRYAWNSIPGNFMWMRPQGRILFKTIAGTAKLPVGGNSQFAGQDTTFPFGYDSGAILQDTPTEYIPPPSPNVEPATPAYTDSTGTDGFELF